MDAKKVIGYRKFTTKAGKPCCVLSVVYPYTERDQEYGAFGSKAEDFFLPESVHSLVVPGIIGKTAEFQYDVVDKHAYVRDVVFK